MALTFAAALEKLRLLARLDNLFPRINLSFLLRSF